jgi:hypothetical protein
MRECENKKRGEYGATASEREMEISNAKVFLNH